MNQLVIFLVFILIIMGKIITISTSKIKNRTAIRKNCDENGIREDLFGSNPHSNGDLFSRSMVDFFLIKIHNNIIIIDIINVNINEIVIFNITFSQ